jgi:hypothetical protein
MSLNFHCYATIETSERGFHESEITSTGADWGLRPMLAVLIVRPSRPVRMFDCPNWIVKLFLHVDTVCTATPQCSAMARSLNVADFGCARVYRWLKR